MTIAAIFEASCATTAPHGRALGGARVVRAVWHGLRSLTCLAAVLSAAGCDKTKSSPTANTETTAPTAASSAETSPHVEPPADPAAVKMPADIDPRCPKLRAEAVKAIGAEVTEIGYWRSINDGPIRCIYKSANPIVTAAVEIGPAGDLAATRKESEQVGKPTDSPLGSHVFRVTFGGTNQVIGVQGTKRIKILGTAGFPQLEGLWQAAARTE